MTDNPQREGGRRRVVVERLQPEIDGGRFAIKRTLGERIAVEASVFADGHDAIACRLLWRQEKPEGQPAPEGAAGQPEVGRWSEAPMEALGNDRWRGELRPTSLGRWLYSVTAWVDHFKTWRRDLAKRVEAGQDVALDLRVGVRLVEEAGERAAAAGRLADARVLAGLARALAQEAPPLAGETPAGIAPEGGAPPRLPGERPAAYREPGDGMEARLRLALDPELGQLMERYADRRHASRYERELAVVVDRERARFSSWYAMFPRSASPAPGRHGTFKDVEQRLAYVAGMGFDVLYLAPIHPIGTTHRKGKNNSPVAAPGDVGSPWAIGAAEGGHKSILPALGSEADFRHLVAAARRHGLEVALDVAFQCSPDHPYVREHPEWFRHRPDGTIQYAENPPKKYEDIYPFDFESAAWRELWPELKSVFDHWLGFGVTIFRVDNPHTKPFAFWEWLIGEVQRAHPEVIFLAEAFTRPKPMYRLAKLGFNQSYNYFPWRTNRWELTEYFTELTRTEVAEYFRPNLWPNTPDILPEHLQFGGRAAFISRLVLAATLGASYGIYGPAFELMEHEARERGSEEYLDSEKYQLRHWQIDRPDSLRDLIALVNRARRENPALQSNSGLLFHATDNEQLLCYSKTAEGGDNAMVMVVNLDPHHVQSGWIDLAPDLLGPLDLGDRGVSGAGGLPGRAGGQRPFQVHDLLTGARYLWHGGRNFVQLDPRQVPAHIFRLRRRVRTERDFDYYL